MKDKTAKKPDNKKKSKEILSKRDIEELMGVHNPVYTRRNGAIRRK